MDAVATLIEKLGKRPELRWASGEDWVRIEPPSTNGFTVELRHEGEEWTVYLGSGGWHQHFDDPADALELIAWCYSGDARVREVYRGQVLQKSVLEGFADGTWNTISVTGYLAPFWQKRSEAILENPNLLYQEQP